MRPLRKGGTPEWLTLQLIADAVRRWLDKIHGGADLSSAIADVGTGKRGVNLWNEAENQRTREQPGLVVMKDGVDVDAAYPEVNRLPKKYLASLKGSRIHGH